VDRAIDQFGQVIDVLVSIRRDASAAYRFFERAISATKVMPIEVTTDQATVYPAVLEELLPAAWHRTDRYANNRVEADHGRLKARLRPMRGLKQERSARNPQARRVRYTWHGQPQDDRLTSSELPDTTARPNKCGRPGGGRG
jgi:transposase-like protein